MKKLYAVLLAALVVLTSSLTATAQVGAPLKPGTASDTLRGIITANRTLTNDKVWYLDGYVLVDSLVTLTVQQGTIIKGITSSKGTLFIQRGAKLVARGTETAPIVFTSDQAVGNRSRQDWGGVALCGRATVNTPAQASLNLAGR